MKSIRALEKSHTLMVWSHLEPKTKCHPGCHLKCRSKCHSENYPEFQDQFDRDKSDVVVMVWSHLEPDKVYWVGGCQTKFNISSRLGSKSKPERARERAWPDTSFILMHCHQFNFVVVLLWLD